MTGEHSIAVRLGAYNALLAAVRAWQALHDHETGCDACMDVPCEEWGLLKGRALALNDVALKLVAD